MAQKNESDASKIARERLLWVLKPIALVSIVMWWLHPNTSQPDVVTKSVLVGFLLGALYGLFLYREAFTIFFVGGADLKQRTKNRMPQEYYFGKIKDVLHGKQVEK